MINRRFTSSLLSISTLLALAAAASGCNQHPIKPVDIDGSLEQNVGLPLDVNKKVDVLVVLDNSGSMGEEQANLAANFGPFIDELDKAGADYRIGITTTELGGWNCDGANTGGTLQLSSCLEREDAFVFQNLNQFATACEAHCALGSAALEILPTAIEGSSEAAPRPWIQSYNGVGNLPEGVGTLEAFQCFAPQGISGCGWESPLEAMKRALDNMEDPTRPEHGFLRDDALLAVLIVTDEVDCSFNPELQSELFEAETFWDPAATHPTSALCWNAGVSCSGDSPYDDCWGADLDAAGLETSDPAQMVLRPVEGYVAALEEVAAHKLSGREVMVSVIAGVPAGYSSGASEQSFADSADPEFQMLFGIGAGCENEVDGVVQQAIPPVRLVDFAGAFAAAGLPEGARNVYSVCEDDYTPAILDIVTGLQAELPPACFPGCVLDLDAGTEELEFGCEVFETVDGVETSLPECVALGGDYELPSEADACWIAKTGAALSDTCVAGNHNLEFDLLRRPGVSVPSGVEVSALCEKSIHPELDCG